MKKQWKLMGWIVCVYLGWSAVASADIIAQFDGTLHISESTYINGLGALGDSNFAEAASNYDLYGDDVIIKVTMGDYIDYFKPTSGNTLEDMLASHDKHLWSSAVNGVFIAPAYVSGSPGTLLGGSALNYPSDGRSYLTFWGAGSSYPAVYGGGLHASSATSSPNWGRSFTMEVVPEPATVGMLALSGLLITAYRRIRKSYGC